MGFVSNLIHKTKEKFRQQKQLRDNAVYAVQRGDVKKAADIAKVYQRGTPEYKAHIKALTDEKVAQVREAAIMKEKIKAAKHKTTGIRAIGVGLSKMVNSPGAQPGRGLELGSTGSPFSSGTRGIDVGGSKKSPFR